MGVTANFNGTLTLELLNGYTPPQTGIAETVVTAKTLQGSCPTTPPGWTTTFDITKNQVVLSR